jgi:multiple antibiotic resistance protein
MSLSAVFFVVDPLGAIPIYMAMTQQDSREKRHSIALRAAVTATLLLLVFAMAGHLIFRMFGITLAAFKVAGGILLLGMSLDMINATQTRARTSPEETQEGIQKDDVAIIPLAIPMLAGPGSISTVMVLMGQTSGSVLKMSAVIGSIVVTGLLAYLFLRSGAFAMKIMGRTGLNIVTRIMGLILSAIAIQFVLNGIHDAYMMFFPTGLLVQGGG